MYSFGGFYKYCMFDRDRNGLENMAVGIMKVD
jgi:hypothetical protein